MLQIDLLHFFSPCQWNLILCVPSEPRMKDSSLGIVPLNLRHATHSSYEVLSLTISTEFVLALKYLTEKHSQGMAIYPA